jgi:hypothetical protein
MDTDPDPIGRPWMATRRQIRKNYANLSGSSSVKFLQFLVIKFLDSDPDADPHCPKMLDFGPTTM